MAQDAMAIVNEHPNPNVRKLYAGQVATHVGLPVNDLVSLAERGARAPVVRVAPVRKVGAEENAEFVAVAMLVQRWEDIAAWVVEELFADEVARRAFRAVAESGGTLDAALSSADPESREYLERAAVADLDVDPLVEAFNLIAAATRRELARRRHIDDPEELLTLRDVRVALERLDDPTLATSAAEALLGWLGESDREPRGADD